MAVVSDLGLILLACAMAALPSLTVATALLKTLRAVTVAPLKFLLNLGEAATNAARPKLQCEPWHVDASLLVTRFDTNTQEIYALAVYNAADKCWDLPRRTLAFDESTVHASKFAELFADLGNERLSALANVPLKAASLHELPSDSNLEQKGVAVEHKVLLINSSDDLLIRIADKTPPTASDAPLGPAWLPLDLLRQKTVGPGEPSLMSDSMLECLAAAHEWIQDDVFDGGQVVTFEHGAELCAPRGAEMLDANAFSVSMTQLDEKGSDFSITPKDPETPLCTRMLRLRLPHCVPVKELHKLVFTRHPDNCDDAEKELLPGGTFAFSGYADHIVYDLCSYALMFAQEVAQYSVVGRKPSRKFLTKGPLKRYVRATLINECTKTTWEVAAANTLPGLKEEEAAVPRGCRAGIGAAFHGVLVKPDATKEKVDRMRKIFSIEVPIRLGLRPLQTVRFVSARPQQLDDLFVSVVVWLKPHWWSLQAEKKVLRESVTLLKGDEVVFCDEDLNSLLAVA